MLGRPDATVDSSFVDLGGDSLSYVELATRLADRLGELPPGWHTRPIVELAAAASRPRRGTALDTTVLLRALAIISIVGTHANLFTLVGGAHLLLVVAGFNFARFQVVDAPRATRVRHGLVAVAQVVVPSTVFIGLVGLVTGGYTAPTALFLNGVLGSDTWTDQWQFWFLEALVWTSLAAVGLLALPGVDRLERRAPLVLAVAAAGRHGRPALRVDRRRDRRDRAVHAGDRAVVLRAGLGRRPVPDPRPADRGHRGGRGGDRRLLRRPGPGAGRRRRGGAAGVAAVRPGAARAWVPP